MAGAFQGLAVGLQAKAQSAQKGCNRVVADPVAQALQPFGQVAQALGGPQQRALRVAGGGRIDQPAQILQQGRIQAGQRLAAPAGPAHPGQIKRRATTQFHKAPTDRAARHPGDPRDHQDAAPARRQRLARRKSPPAPLIAQGAHRLVPQTDRCFVNHTAMLESQQPQGIPQTAGNPLARFTYCSTGHQLKRATSRRCAGAWGRRRGAPAPAHGRA
jgi:hypothetical protein